MKTTHLIRTIPVDLPPRQSAFLWGPRKVGKSTLLKQRFPGSIRYDFLKSDLFLEVMKDPSRLRSRIEAQISEGAITLATPIILDEVQKIPAVLDEVHWLIEERGCSFILCGSSARKLKRGHANMLGGRAWRYQMHPLTVQEIPGFNLLHALKNGMLPSHYLQNDAKKSLQAYILDYLKEEIIAEGVSRNIPAFTRFIDILGFCCGEQIVYGNIARDTGVATKTVQEYFQILSDTMIGSLIAPFSRTGDRDIISKIPKFYFFDVGISSYFSKRTIPEERGSEFGRALEQLIFMELSAYHSYREIDSTINYWRKANGNEVDFILGAGEIALEVKSASGVTGSDLTGIFRFAQDYSPRKAIVITTEKARRKTGAIDLIPWQDFLDDLWSGKIIS